MSFELSQDLWPPQRRGLEQVIERLEDDVDVCLFGPTGSGKTRQAIELFRWCQAQGLNGSFYVNRKLLIGQTSMRFDEAGLRHGVRAADYEDKYDYKAQFQICSADTERSRVYKRKIWPVCPSHLVIVDEAHIQKSDTMKEIIKDQKERGARVVLLTATPIGLSHMADELVISGRMQEYRDCKSLVPARIRSFGQPDMYKVKRNLVGEYIMDGKRRKEFVQHIVGNVKDLWKKWNPDARPTLLYAPGKPESVWLTEQFMAMGVQWCHVDATDAIVAGERYKLTRALWDDIVGMFEAGEIKGISSRFKLREGVDLPFTYHAILATPIGSLASYIQTVGRVLRYSKETPDEVLITDHGGNFLRHGSPNHDRDWRGWWLLPEATVSKQHEYDIKNGDTPEPICCPECTGERTSGFECPHCGHKHSKSKRHIEQEDGTFQEKDGRLIRPKFVREKPDTQRLWSSMFFGFRNKKVDRTFAQMEAFFCHEYGYYPPRSMDHMPTTKTAWHQKVHAASSKVIRWPNKEESAA